MTKLLNIKFCVALAMCCACIPSFCEGIGQVIGAHSNSACGATSFGYLERYEYDLRQNPYHDADNTAVAIDGIGTWILYDYPGYQGESEVVTVRSLLDCVPLRRLVRRASSVKHVGESSDYRAPTITLYQGTNFTGREMFLTQDHPKALLGDGVGKGGFSEVFGSYIITGGSSSCWTLHDAVREFAEYHPSICVCGEDTPDFQPLLVPQNPFPPANRVGSVKRGCIGQERQKEVKKNSRGQEYRDGVLVGSE